MEKKIKAWVYCRISPHAPKSLLNFQKAQLDNIANENNMIIVGHTNVISNGKFLNSFELQNLILEIRRQSFDILLINSPMRISIYPDIFEEFEMMCRLYNIKVLSYIDYINKK